MGRRILGQGASDERRRLLERVRARLDRFGEDRDPGVVLSAEAEGEVSALLEAAEDPAADLEVAHAAGWLHWARYLVLKPGDDQQDLAAALSLFAPATS